MDFIETLLQKREDYRKELLFAEAKIAVVEDLIDTFNTKVVEEETVEEIVEETAEQPTDTMY